VTQSRASTIKIDPAAAVRGAAAVPGNKGSSQRAALLGAVADGESRIRGFGRAADTVTALDAARTLGAEVVDNGDDDIRVRGVGLRGLRSATIDCGNAGTVLRLLCGLLVGQRGQSFELVGDESLTMRPHERAAAPLRLMGARIETTEGHAPVRIVGSDLQPIAYELPVASAQVKSAVLLAGLYADTGPTTVIEPHPTRDHTERMLQSVGVRVSRTDRSASVWPVDGIPPLDIDIPGDISSAAPLIVAAVLLNGSELILHNVNVNPLRTGLLGVLDRMGARIAVFNRRTTSGEPVAELEVHSTPLVATTVEAAEVPRLVDELPLVALLGSFARGTTIVRGAEELRAKETDRIDTVVDGLRALGVRIEAKPDGFVVRGTPRRPRGGRIDSRGDHRIAMLGAVAGLVSREGVEIEDAECAGVSFPGFYDLLEQLAQR
jgi:3-phosphoshikimate 1-carboxyvinyltransferase